MSKVMIIGCGGVASVAIHKCCQNSEVFSEIMIASRTLSKCDALKEKLAPTTKTIITTAKVDADCTEELIALIKQYQKLFELDDVKLELTEEAVERIAELAVERKTGARGLRSIMESVMMDIMYEIPSDSNIGICTITKAVVNKEGEPEIIYRDTTVPRKSLAQKLRKDKTGEIA